MAPDSSVRIRPSTGDDDVALRALLHSVGLPIEDVATGRQEYRLAFDGERLAGAVGLEVVGEDGLLRSLAVAPAYRGRGLSRELCRSILAAARARGLRTLYLLTTTAEGLAAREGFERIDRSQVPAGILGLPQFRALCPATAVCMRRPCP